MGPISIKKLVLDIKKNHYVLPSIQREMVWEPEQIEKLFDSIMSGYPIGAMFFWNYEYRNDRKYKFYEFIKKYDEYDKYNNRKSSHNPIYSCEGETEITAVLDGQQRLTALYLGLLGSLNIHKPRTHYKYSENYELRKLYIDLLYEKDSNVQDETLTNYKFKFKTQEEVEKENKDGLHYWFLVGNILNFSSDKDYKEFVPDLYNQANEDLKDKIRDLFRDMYKYFVESSNIVFFEEDTSSFDRVLQMFVRINSGGTQLSYTDLLMSIIVNQWGDGREKINDSLDAINSEYDFSIPKDIFLRGCLFMTGLSLVFKVDNFEQKNIAIIKNNFDEIVKYIKSACRIFNEFGYNRNNLRSNLIILPLAKYMYRNKINDIDIINKRRVLRWIQLSIVNRVFGSQTTNYLTRLRTIIDNSVKDFPLDKIKQESALMERNMDISEELLEDIIEKAQYGSQDSWSLLTLLQNNLAFEDKEFHEDHIYPYSKLSKEQLTNGGNYLANLQLLEGKKNKQKQDKLPEEWIQMYCKSIGITEQEYKEKHFIPQIELTAENFDQYIRDRKILLKNALLAKLKADF